MENQNPSIIDNFEDNCMMSKIFLRKKRKFMFIAFSRLHATKQTGALVGPVRSLVQVLHGQMRLHLQADLDELSREREKVDEERKGRHPLCDCAYQVRHVTLQQRTTHRSWDSGQ